MSLPPLSFLEGAGSRADAIVPLTWAVIVISVAVCLIISALLIWGLRRVRSRGGAAETRAVTVERGGNGLRWLAIGIAASLVPLLVTLVWTMTALGHLATPPRRGGLTVEVTAHQWWWEAKYASRDPAQNFVTANEIHVPVGVPVLLKLNAGDVIHSFWVPRLSGKTDLIPGQTNLTWLQAYAPGVYLGQCAEYCGAQHARMAFQVVAEPLRKFEAWRRAQLQTAPPPVTAAQARGLALVEFRCAMCHTVRGTSALASVGPDLTHVMSRRTIAAGTLPNTPGNLVGWIANPQATKPGALMPDQHLSGPALNDLLAYMETLR